VKTKAQLARILGSKFDLAGFDFRTGRVLSGGVHRRQCQLICLFLHFFLIISVVIVSIIIILLC